MKLFKFLSICTFLLALTFPNPATAQSIVSGQIDGRVTDATGAVVPNATVNLSSAEIGYSASTSSDNEGVFHFPLVKPGPYVVTVTKEGFATAKRNIVVSLGQVSNVPIPLEVSGKTETVEITTAVPLLQTENANLATTVSRASIENIPSPGQDITNFAMTTPGVTLSTGAGYGNITANGLPGTSNLYTVNGNDYNDPYLNLNNSGASNLLLGANELQEITVVTNGYTGQYGRMAGANVNYTTKGGTNQFHGNANYYYNGSVLNANDWFANNQVGGFTPRPHAVSNEWAGSVGGPIIKDKLFFFFDYEGLRYVLPGGGLTYIPTTDFANATLANLQANNPGAVPFYTNIFNLYNGAKGGANATPEPGNCGALSGLPVYGQPGMTFDDGTAGPSFLTCAKSYTSNVNNLNSEQLYSITGDWNITPKDTLRLRYKHDWGTQATGTDPVNSVFNANSVQPEWDGQGLWTHVFSGTKTNQFVFSGLYYSAIFGPPDINAALATFPTTITFNDGAFTNMGGTDNNYPQGRKVTQYQFVDDFSWTLGKHIVKFGGNFRRNDISSFAMYPNTSGTITENSLQDFYNGYISTAGGGQATQAFTNFGNQPIAYFSLGLYAQDEWKVTSQLTMTLALRWDHNSPEVCQHDCFTRLASQFSDLTHDATIPYNQAVLTGLHQAFPSYDANTWGPRIGFSWTPDTHGLSKPNSTVIRGGFGLFSDLYPGFLADRFITNLPNVSSFAVAPAAGNDNIPISPDQANNAFTQLAASNAELQSQFASGGTIGSIQAALPSFSTPTFNSIANHIKNPQFLEWNLQVQQAIGSNTSVSVNYVGNHGYNIFINNTGVNTYCKVCGLPTYVANFGDLPNATIDPRFAAIREYGNAGISNYNGLTVNLTERMSHGLQFAFNYTYAHSLDEVSNGGLLQYSLQTGGDSIVQQVDPYNLSHNYGNSDYDFRHFISANYYYQMPFKSENKALNALIGGWQISGTVFWRTGQPFSVYNSLISSRIFGNNTYANRVIADYLGGSTTCSGPGSDPTVSCLGASFAGYQAQSDFGNTGRNFFRGPQYFNTDFSLFKDFHFTESMLFTVGASAYNVLNHPNFANPYDNAGNPGLFGQILNTVGAPNSPYGNFQGATVNGRVLQIMGKFRF